MILKRTYSLAFGILIIVLIGCFLLNLSLGSVSIPFEEILTVLGGGSASKTTWQHIILEYRLPKALTAILVGCGLSISGLLMQTLFRNPLAGPFVLGISSGASLGVAILIMGSSLIGWQFISTSYSLAIASSLGSFLVLLAVIIVASRVRDTMAILIIGLMFGSITSAIVSVLSYFSKSEQLRQYVFWNFGSLGDVSWQQLQLFACIICAGILFTIYVLKALNAFLLGENYARSLGIDIKKTRFIIIIATSLLAGGVTAFAGPIAFIGLAVPHMAKQLFKTTNHTIILPATFFIGAILMLLCDTIAQLPGSQFSLPINAITSLIGAPVFIWLLVRKRKMIF